MSRPKYLRSVWVRTQSGTLCLLLATGLAGGCGPPRDGGKHPQEPAEVPRTQQRDAPTHPRPEAAPGTVVEMIQRIAGMETLSQPDPQEVANIAGGGTVIATESPTSFEVKTRFDGVQVLVDRGSLPQVRLRTALRRGLTLGELSAVFGEPRKVMESKTSSVVFELTQGGRRALMFVQLFTPKVADTSPVLSITVRRDNAA